MDYKIYSILAPYIGLVGILLLILIGRRWPYSSARYMFWFVLCAYGYLVSNYLELIAATEYWTVFWATLVNIFGSLIPVSWLLFVFDFIGRHEWKRLQRFWPFFLPALLCNTLVLTNGYHHLFWKELRFIAIEPGLALQIVHGSLFYVVMLLHYTMILLGLMLIIQEFGRSRETYRRQLFCITLGISIALAFNFLYIFHTFPWLKKDFTPIGYALAGIIYIIIIRKHRFLELNPAPRSKLFDVLLEGIIVIDGDKRITDLNRTAMTVLGLSDADLGSCIYGCAPLAPLFNRFDEDSEMIRGDVTAEVSGSQCSYEVLINPLYGYKKRRYGALIILHDITERVRLFEEIRTLKGTVPICSRCKRIRTESGNWQNLETYISEHSYAEFSHGLCPECLRAQPPEDTRTRG